LQKSVIQFSFLKQINIHHSSFSEKHLEIIKKRNSNIYQIYFIHHFKMKIKSVYLCTNTYLITHKENCFKIFWLNLNSFLVKKTLISLILLINKKKTHNHYHNQLKS